MMTHESAQQKMIKMIKIIKIIIIIIEEAPEGRGGVWWWCGGVMKNEE